ncbi:MAG: protease SohB, partial [Marinobacter alexandrii]
MEFLTEYGLFLAKVVTFAVAAIVVVAVIIASAQKEREDHGGDGELKIRKLNEKYDKLRESIQARLMSDAERKAFEKRQ